MHPAHAMPWAYNATTWNMWTNQSANLIRPQQTKFGHRIGLFIRPIYMFTLWSDHWDPMIGPGCNSHWLTQIVETLLMTLLKTLLKLCWCDSEWWRYKLNSTDGKSQPIWCENTRSDQRKLLKNRFEKKIKGFEKCGSWEEVGWYIVSLFCHWMINGDRFRGRKTRWTKD